MLPALLAGIVVGALLRGGARPSEPSDTAPDVTGGTILPAPGYDPRASGLGRARWAAVVKNPGRGAMAQRIGRRRL